MRRTQANTAASSSSLSRVHAMSEASESFRCFRALRPFAVLLCCALSLSAHAAEPRVEPRADDALVSRMTDLQVRMFPFGAIFEMLAKDDPKWPMQQNPDAVTSKQLDCLRGELSQDGYRRYKQARVETYVAANPKRAEAEVELLSQGAAELFGKLVLAGADAERSGAPTTPEVVLKDATPEQMMAFMTFFSDPNYAELRKMSGLGDAIALDKSAEENESAGEQLGSTITMQIMLGAMKTCEVSTSVLFGK
jgi:hypothetical protein